MIFCWKITHQYWTGLLGANNKSIEMLFFSILYKCVVLSLGPALLAKYDEGQLAVYR